MNHDFPACALFRGGPKCTCVYQDPPDATARTNDPVIADNGPPWRYEIPPRTNAKVLLLTVGDVQTSGQWYGKLGEHFKAWCPLPRRDKELEAKLGLLTSGDRDA